MVIVLSALFLPVAGRFVASGFVHFSRGPVSSTPEMTNKLLGLLLLLSLGCGDDDASLDGGSETIDSGDDSGRTPDASADSGDAGDDAGPDDAGGDDATSDTMADAFDAGPACGTERANVATVITSAGVAVAPDGTIYYTWSSFIGRIRPGADPEPRWIDEAGSGPLAYSESDGTLFVGSRSRIYRADVAAGTAELYLTLEAGTVNSLIAAGDGTVLYTSGRSVMRAAEGESPTQVADVEGGAFGLLLDDDGTILTNTRGNVIWRISLDDAWVEESREMVADLDYDGDTISEFGKDVMGRYYVVITDGRLLRYDASFETEEELPRTGGVRQFAWGRGPLLCTDLYLALAERLEVIDVGTTGRP